MDNNRGDIAMKALTPNEVTSNILKILELVQNGEEIIIKSDKNQEKVAIIISYEQYKQYLQKRERPLGILKGKASYKIKDGFKITDEELLTL